MSVSQTIASMPTAPRIATASRCSLRFAEPVAERGQRFLEPGDRPSLPQRQVRGVARLQGQHQHGALLVSVSMIRSWNASTAASRRFSTSSPTPGGSSETAAVSGWAATSSAVWFGKYR